MKMRKLKVFVLTLMLAFAFSFTANAQNKVTKQDIEIKQFNLGDFALDLCVVKYDLDGDLSTAEEVFLALFPTGGLATTVENLTDYTFDVVGDDGRSWGIIKYSQINLADTKAMSLDWLVDYLRDFALSPQNKAFEIKRLNLKLIPRRETGLTKLWEEVMDFDNSWIKKIKDIPSNFGEIMQTAELSTEAGNYVIDFYSNDSDARTYETVVVSRDDGLKCKVDGLKQVDLTFYNWDCNEREKVSISMIDLSWPKIGEKSIFDNELFNALYSLTQDNDFNKAFKVSVLERFVNVDKFGTLYTKQMEEKILK